MTLDKHGRLIVLRGPVPCKKSKYRRGSRGGLYLDVDTSKAIGDLILQARSQWRRDPVEHPEVTVTFHVTHSRADRDGKLATLLDVLQRAGVIRNDNVRRFNGWLHIAPAVVGDAEGVDVEVSV